jgi:predicted nucleotidyltransferase
MKTIDEICHRFHISLCYLFGSQAEAGKALLSGSPVEMEDPESDIDFAVLFIEIPEDGLKTYAALSLELQDLVRPFRADLLFLHEVDHLIQLEAIQGICVFSLDNERREEYEERVMKCAADELEIFRRNEKDMFEAIDDGYFEFEYKAD